LCFIHEALDFWKRQPYNVSEVKEKRFSLKLLSNVRLILLCAQTFMTIHSERIEKMKKIVSAVLTVLLVAVVFTGCAAQKNNTLKVGMELAYPPFETKDIRGNPSGISVDLAKALGEYLGRPVEIENTAWDGLIPSLQTGKVDVVISSMTITDDRKKIVDFSDPYAHSYLALLVNKNLNITKAAELNKKGIIVDVKKGTTGNIYANNNLTNAAVNALTSENACVTEVIQGKANAFIYDQLTIYRESQSNKDTTRAIMIPFQSSENWGMAVKKGNTELLTKINVFIAKYKSDGGFDKLTQKYLANEKKTFDKLGFPWFFD
jgi:polar amino acid transport system substrate-binding protein